MKFVSKIQNYRLVLRPGIPGNSVMGIPPTPGLYVKFEQGIVIVNDQNIVDLILASKFFGRDFVAIKEGDVDPYLPQRKPTENEHVTTEMDGGRPVGTVQSQKPAPKGFTAAVKEETVKQLQSLIPKLREEIYNKVKSELLAEAEGKKRPGRPKKIKEAVQESEPVAPLAG